MTTTFAVLLGIAIAIAASLILALISNQRRQNKTEKLRCSFHNAEAEFNLSISKQEILGKRVIGLDDANNKLLFVEANGNKYDGYLIDLDEIQSCIVKKVYGTLSTGKAKRKSAEAYVNTIGLQLDYTNGAKPIILSFYDKVTHPDFDMREGAKQAKEWQALLSTRLTRKDNKVEKRKNSDKKTYAAIIEEATAFTKD